MNKDKIKICIKNGYAWTDVSKSPVRVPINVLRAMTGGWENDEHLHATKREAQAAIDARKADPEPPRWEERKEGDKLMIGDKATYCKNCSSSDPKDWPTLHAYHDEIVRGRTVEECGCKACFESPAHVAWRKRQEAKANEGYCKAGGAITKEQLTEEAAVKLRNGDRSSESEAKAAAHDKTKQPERKFAEMPSWCPPLPEDTVFLGFGSTFKTDRESLVYCIPSSKDSDWGKPHRASIWVLTCKASVFAAPRNSEIAILNYPWLKDEAGDKPSPTEAVASHKTPSGDTQAKEVSTDEAQAVTILNHERGQRPTKTLSLANYGGAIPDHFTLDCKNFTFEQIQTLIEQNFVSSNHREWTDIPQPLVPRNDPVNHPSHYTSSPSGIECIQVTEWMGFLLGNAVKYIWRASSKGNEKQDLEKAIWYIQRRIAQIEKEVKK